MRGFKIGKIPEYRRAALRPQVADTSGFAQADATRAQAASLNALTSIASGLGELQAKKEELRDKTYLNKSAIDLQNRSDEVVREWQSEFAEDPMGGREELDKRLGELKSEFVEAAPSEFAKNKMGETSDRYFLSVGRGAQKWEDQQVVQNTSRAAGEGLEALQVKVLRDSSPQALALAKAEAEQVIAPLKDTVRPELVEEARKRFENGATMSMFQGMVEKNQLTDAKGLLDSQEYDKALGVDGITKVKSAIDRKKKFNQAKRANFEGMKLKNPWGYLQKAGEKIPQLDLQTMDPDSFLKRSAFIDDMNKKHGLKLQYLAPQEENFFVNELPKQQATKQVEFIGALNQLPRDEYYQVASQVFDKNPAYGAVYGLMRGGNRQAAEDSRLITSGMGLVKKNKETGKKGIFSPSNKQVGDAFDPYVNNSIRDPRQREAVRDAAFYHYSQRQFDKGEFSDELDVEEYQKSVDAIVGQPFKFNDSTLLPFRDQKTGQWVEPDDLEDTLDSMTDARVEKAQGDVPRTASGEPINLEKSRDRINLQSVGEGKYWLFVDDKITMDSKNQFFILDAQKLHQLPPDQKRGGFFNDVLKSLGSGIGLK